MASEVTSQPRVTIASGGKMDMVPLRDLWAYRELFVFLIWRDLKVRYKQTALGVLWALLQPLAATLILTLVGRLAGMGDQDGVPYALYLFCGMLPWTFLANAVTASSNSLLASTALITKVYFPRVIIPTAAIGAGLVDFAVGLCLLPIMLVLYGVPASVNLVFLPFICVLLALLALAVGLFTSAASVQFRDVRYILPFFMQLWMFASPIIYQRSRVSPDLVWILDLNPMSGILTCFRSIMLGTPMHWAPLLYSCAFTVAFLVFATWMFRRMEKVFADVI